MNCNQYITNRIKGKHLTLVERVKIEALFKAKLSYQVLILLVFHYSREKTGLVYGILNYDLSTRNEYSSEKAQISFYSKEKARRVKNW